MFDIYSFINSKDVAKHLKNIHYVFTPQELAFLVWHSNGKTLEERVDAWREIIERYPEAEIWRSNEHRSSSLAQFLTEFIDVEKNAASQIKKQAENVSYGGSVQYGGGFTGNVVDCKTFEDFLAGINHYSSFKREVIYAYAKLTRTERVEDQDDRVSGEITARINGKGEILLVEYESGCDAKTRNLYDTFSDIQCVFPVPFQKGDIVILPKESWHNVKKVELNPLRSDSANNAFVFLGVSDWDEDLSLIERDDLISFYERRDAAMQMRRLKRKEPNMAASGYFVDEHGALFRGESHCYFDLVFYRGELNGRNKILWAVSNFLKGKTELSLFVNAYHIQLCELATKSARKECESDDYSLYLAGLRGNSSSLFPWEKGDELNKWIEQFDPLGDDEDENLRELAWGGLIRRANEIVPTEDRLYEELNLIKELGLSRVFLTAEGISYSVRRICHPHLGGEWNASYVAYALGITNMNPLDTSTPCQRLFHKYKKSLPKLQFVVPRGMGETVRQAIGARYWFFTDVIEENLPVLSERHIMERFKNGREGEAYDDDHIIRAAAKRYREEHLRFFQGDEPLPYTISQFADFIAYDKMRREKGISPQYVYYEQIFKILTERFDLSMDDAAEAIHRLATRKDVGDVKNYILDISREMDYDDGETQEIFQEMNRSARHAQLRAAMVSYARYLYLCEEYRNHI